MLILLPLRGTSKLTDKKIKNKGLNSILNSQLTSFSFDQNGHLLSVQTIIKHQLTLIISLNNETIKVLDIIYGRGKTCTSNRIGIFAKT
jgi:hypothetical protein